VCSIPFRFISQTMQGITQRLPRDVACVVADSDLSEAAPVQLRADAVFLLKGAAGRLEGAVVLEVQRDWDRRKEFTWPLYAMQTRARHECPAVVLVVALDPVVAARARRPIGLDDLTTWRARVLGPDLIPRLEDEAVVQRFPTLGILSALAHGHELEDFKVVKAAANGLPASSLDPEVVGYYLQVMDEAFGPALRAAMERAMQVGEVRAPGPMGQYFINQGIERGIEQGIERGRSEGIRQSLLSVLTIRKLSTTKEHLVAIEQCSDAQTLNQWMERAVVASSADEVFAPSAP
jgi:hypothetical protein